MNMSVIIDNEMAHVKSAYVCVPGFYVKGQTWSLTGWFLEANSRGEVILVIPV